ncbi:hypothetical protein CMI47_11445 [Candidatus Pacearchaeota archaeon]|nr:hypothetical protein [Candidatus Pacearchaeota archaeon]|tara:strand:+ start:1157 stop:1840 length:684 start_codon:yes stop_codon:yes gene_type:complete
MKKIDTKYISSLILDERVKLQEELRMYSAILREADRMHHEGSDRKAINENIIDLLTNLISPLLDPAMQTFRNKMTLFMLSRFGLNPQGKMARIVGNVLEEIGMDDLGEILGGDKCDVFVKELTRGLVEALATEPVFDTIAEYFGINKGGTIYIVLREKFQNKLNEELFKSEISESLFKEIESVVCTIEYRDVLGGFFDRFKEKITDMPGLDDVGTAISQRLSGNEQE